jgi:hypothetical protein
VANADDGVIALFLGGRGGLTLEKSESNPDLPHPTSLALDPLSGSVLQFYAGTEGREAATLLAFNLAGAAGGATIAEPPATTAPTEQVTRLQPLGGSTTLALVATLVTVSAEGESPAFAEAAVTTTAEVAAAPPNQSPRGQGSIELAGTDEPDAEGGDTPGPPAPPAGSPTPLLRFLHRMDHFLERIRSDVHRDLTAPGAPGGDRPAPGLDIAPTTPNTSATDPHDAALRELYDEEPGFLSADASALPSTSPGPTSPIVAAVALWLGCRSQAVTTSDRGALPAAPARARCAPVRRRAGG